LRRESEVKRLFGRRILVCGGNLPGCSTDYDAALFAQAIKADLLINATDVDGVYSADPKKVPHARKFKKLSYDGFIRILSKLPQAPGKYRLFDLNAAKLIKIAKIKTIVVDGRDAEEIRRAVQGEHDGTEIG
jgi:uridylate kinase